MADSCGAVDVSVSGGLDPFLGKASPLDPHFCEVDTLRCEPEKFRFLGGVWISLKAQSFLFLGGLLWRFR